MKKPVSENADFLISESRKHISTIFKLYFTEDSLAFREHYPKIENDPPEAYFWTMSALYSAIIQLEISADNDISNDPLIILLEKVLERYWDSDRTPSAYQAQPVDICVENRFYDDNEWIGLDMLQMYRSTNNGHYLDRALEIAEFIISGSDDILDGGIYWCEQLRDTKNACSNGPACLFFLELYEITGNNDYFVKGVEFYRWNIRHLRDEDGLFVDNIKVDGSVDGKKYAYNTGVMIQAAVTLFRIDENEEYMSAAMRMAKGASIFFKTLSEDGHFECPDRMPWFMAVLLRGYEALMLITDNAEYAKELLEAVIYTCRNGRDNNGLIGNDFGHIDENASKWLLDQAAFVEMCARAARMGV